MLLITAVLMLPATDEGVFPSHPSEEIIMLKVGDEAGFFTGKPQAKQTHLPKVSSVE
jgi:hypothetical protein